ncbi:MAG TPA: NAD(P)/FAD-dependent oxidoreductase [Kofleriaceae bacterium]|nr:NAD(P)/FAD-dependent oxidoreductase [Kofleriaceae bacterium]
MTPAEHLDVVIVGAGLSGIGAAYHVRTYCPSKTYAILEARACSGGTWDLFRYPGVRSDSDMYTLGYSFRPWTDPHAIADGASILAYIRDTAAAYGIDRKIRYRHRAIAVRWSSAEARWTLDVRVDDARIVQLTCSFLFTCTGYYDYAAGYTPELPGRARYRGRIVHPQQWPADLDYTGKRVIVIGSGATAVTLVPTLAAKAAHVTMLQRSPSYVISLPSRDRVADALRAVLPAGAAHDLVRWKSVLLGMGFYELSRRFPERARRLLVAGVEQALGTSTDVRTHFSPRYNVWDQRVCFVPDADLFRAIRDGRASVVTDHIATFTETGLALRSGATLDADIIITATGLVLQFLGGMTLAVDGERVDPAKLLVFNGMMTSDVPNFAFASGYTNASWTLKVDLVSRYVCRLLAHMDEHGYRAVRPIRTNPAMQELPVIDFSSGYVQRALADMPRQGSERPWRLYQNYVLDLLTLRYGRVDDRALRFT